MVNQEKSHFCCSKVRYLGYIVNEHGLYVDPDKVQGIGETDASATGSGAFLIQTIDHKKYVIAYGSRVLTSAERNFSATE